jgi:peptidoglycan lytic transglycosylase
MVRLTISIASVLGLIEIANAADGIASRYGRSSGARVACGGELNESALTAAHRTLPCGSRARVKNKQNGHSVVVTINDRGPFIKSRIIDLTPAAARALGFNGLAQVSVTPQ